MADKQFKYVEIVRDKGNLVIKRIDVSGQGERAVNRVESGVGINLNHKEFTTRVQDYDTAQPNTDEQEKK